MLKRAVHPGQILSDELAELGVTATEFARQIEVPPNRVSQIISGIGTTALSARVACGGHVMAGA